MLCCLCRGRGCVQCSGTQPRSSNAALEKFLHKVETQHDSCGIPTTRIVILGSKASVPVQERIKSVGCRESCTSACRFALLSFMVVNIKFSCVPDFELAGLLFGWFVERSLLSLSPNKSNAIKGISGGISFSPSFSNFNAHEG